MSDLIEFTKKDESNFYSRKKFGIFYKPLKSIHNAYNRIIGNFTVEDQLKIACSCEPSMFFLKHGVMIPHAYGVTLSIDKIGSDCYIGQNVTIGTNAKYMKINEVTTGHKPKIGNLVRIYANSVVSGEITIGDYSIIAAQTFVNKDVPPKSIVYGVNKIKPLEKNHLKYLQMVLYHCIHIRKLVPGLIYAGSQLFIDNQYLKKREELAANIGKDSFGELL